MTLTQLLTTDPYGCGFAAPIAAGNFAQVTALLNQRGLGGQTVPVPAAVSPTAVLGLVSQAHLQTILQSGQANELDTALAANDVPTLTNLLAGFVAAGWIDSTEQTAIAGYLTGLATQTQSVPATPAEAAGLVPYGGTVPRYLVEAAL